MAKTSKVKKVETQEEPTQQPQIHHVESTPTDTANTVINLQDLRNIIVVFDLASARGAFKGPELEPIGQLYNKIAKFVQAATPPVEEPPAPTEKAST